ncbi:MAG: hypothetical protein MUO18_03880 [Methanomassiliicoccales archaeon]|nr:hypothetical protein [Methanomassiliicoccales archaeon]
MGMTRVFDESGAATPVTVVLVEKKGAAIEQSDISGAVVKAVAPDARFKVFYVKGS